MEEDQSRVSFDFSRAGPGSSELCDYCPAGTNQYNGVMRCDCMSGLCDIAYRDFRIDKYIFTETNIPFKDFYPVPDLTELGLIAVIPRDDDDVFI